MSSRYITSISFSDECACILHVFQALGNRETNRASAEDIFSQVNPTSHIYSSVYVSRKGNRSGVDFRAGYYPG
jgi:hypothetical protein